MDNEVQLDNTLFLATGLSGSSSFRGFVLLVTVLVARQSIILIRCCDAIVACM
jgi:hypothetical protein